MSTSPVRKSNELPREATPPAPEQTQVSPGIGAAHSSISPMENPATPNAIAAPDIELVGAIPLIPVQYCNWVGMRTTHQIRLDTALDQNLITPKEALQQGHCTPGYLTALGFDQVVVDFNLDGMKYIYRGTLREALKNEVLTIEEAIRLGLIIRKQATEGGWLKVEPPPKEKKS
ncbi:MAG TPA: hypothetical protein VMR37_00290 [Rhabdochlamydiaceae bacterium]|nr:hypothetical protein [Rhabdochlamydiaceae bacterium]